MEEALEIIYEESQKLKSAIELIELYDSMSGKGLLTEVLIKKIVNVKIKMYQEKHNLPHLHIDIGNQTHSASISIENQKVLEGGIERKYEKAVLCWIEKNKDNLLLIWNNLKKGQELDLSVLN